MSTFLTLGEVKSLRAQQIDDAVTREVHDWDQTQRKRAAIQARLGDAIKLAAGRVRANVASGVPAQEALASVVDALLPPAEEIMNNLSATADGDAGVASPADDITRVEPVFEDEPDLSPETLPYRDVFADS